MLYWALYNEPDNADPVGYNWLGGCWGRSHPNSLPGAGGAAYANMLKVAYPAIKAGNPNAKVVLGGLAYENWWQPETGGNGPFDLYFLDDLLTAGGRDYFDIINFHYYPPWAWIWNDPNDRYASDIIGKALYIRNQIGNKPILCSEVGLPTSGPASDTEPYSDERTARYVIQANVRAMSIAMPLIIWLQAVDEAWLGRTYGLLRSDLSPKPAYFAYRTLNRELTNARFLNARRDFPVSIEGYDFDVAGRKKTVLWTTSEFGGNQPLRISAAGGSLRVVDKLGNETLYVDGGAGDTDGARNRWINVYIDASPRFVEDLGLATATPSPPPPPPPPPTATSTAAPTSTPSPLPTNTPTSRPTATPTHRPTNTSTPHPTATLMLAPSPTPTQTTDILPDPADYQRPDTDRYIFLLALAHPHQRPRTLLPSPHSAPEERPNSVSFQQ